MKTLYTAEAIVEGGRAGHGRTSDGRLDVDLSVPEGLGGKGGTGTNPEQLFAVGYAACFQSAFLNVASGRKLDAVRLAYHVARDPRADRSRRHDAGCSRWTCTRRSCSVSRGGRPHGAGARTVSVFERHARQHRCRTHRRRAITRSRAGCVRSLGQRQTTPSAGRQVAPAMMIRARFDSRGRRGAAQRAHPRAYRERLRRRCRWRR